MNRQERLSGDQIARTVAPPDFDIVFFGPFSLNQKTRLLEKDGVSVKLGSRVLDILRLLVNRASEVVSKHELLSYAWADLVVDEISLRVHIAEPRKALGDGKAGARYITNVPSRGYCLVAPLHYGGNAVSPGTPEKTTPVSLPYRLERMIGREDVLEELSSLSLLKSAESSMVLHWLSNSLRCGSALMDCESSQYCLIVG